AKSRESPEAAGEQVRCVRVVTAEELVATLTGEGDLDITRGQLRDEIRRQRRRVGERLVERVGGGGEETHGGGPQHQLAMLRAVALRHEARIRKLVERALLEA